MTYTVLNSQYQSSLNPDDMGDTSNFQNQETEEFSDIKVDDMADNDMETRIWAQFVRERQSRTTDYIKGGKNVSDATNSKSTYTSSTKGAKHELLIKPESDTFSAFDA